MKADNNTVYKIMGKAQRYFIRLKILIPRILLTVIILILITIALLAGYEKSLMRFFVLVILFLLVFLLVDFLSIPFLQSHGSIRERFPIDITRKPKPYIMFGGSEFGKMAYETLNRLGYKGKCPSIVKEPGEFKIFILGGSTVFNGNPPIAMLLEEEFKRNGFQGVNVYNFGVVSSISTMDLSRILFEISEFKPDLIIMYNGCNDMNHPYHWDPRPGYPFDFIAHENNVLVKSDLRTYPTLPLLLFGSNILRYFFTSYFVQRFTHWAEIRKEVKYKTEEWKNNIANIYVKNLVKADKISKAFGADFVAFFQPTLYFKSYISDEEKRYLSSSATSYYMEMREKILSKIETAKKDFHVNIIDLSDIYNGMHECIFIDPFHTNQRGKTVIAQKIFTRIVDCVTEKKSKYFNGDRSKRRA